MRCAPIQCQRSALNFRLQPQRFPNWRYPSAGCRRTEAFAAWPSGPRPRWRMRSRTDARARAGDAARALGRARSGGPAPASRRRTWPIVARARPRWSWPHRRAPNFARSVRRPAARRPRARRCGCDRRRPLGSAPESQHMAAATTARKNEALGTAPGQGLRRARPLGGRAQQVQLFVPVYAQA